MNNDLKPNLTFKQMVSRKGMKRSRQNVFMSYDSDRNKVIEVKRRLSLGDGLCLIPTSVYEIE